ncbi:hypothetical protein ACVIGA_008451 [Bradyrhizobium sp. USDA 3240]
MRTEVDDYEKAPGYRFAHPGYCSNLRRIVVA